MACYHAFSATVIGSSHTKHGKECQDFSLEVNTPKGSAALTIVADGHGADECFRSAKGAELAAACAKLGIAEFVKQLNEKPGIIQKPLVDTLTIGEFEKKLQGLVNHIIAKWHDEVDRHIKTAPFTTAELEAAGEKYHARYEKGESLHKAYGTTLIAAAITPKYWFGLHIGDGRLTALYANGSFDQPVTWDEKCFLNQTTSICDDDAAERARVFVSLNRDSAPPVAVFLCSDGVDDNYPVDDNAEHLWKLYRTIALTFAEDGFESTCAQLKDLANSFATKGKGDDTSIAGIIDMDKIKHTAPRWKKQIADEEMVAKVNAIADTVQCQERLL
jgi:serine/threonine protein phosphatase PrpC